MSKNKDDKGQGMMKKMMEEKKNRIRTKLMFMDTVDDDELYPAIRSILPVQYSRNRCIIKN